LREPKTEPMMWLPLAQVPFKISSVSLLWSAKHATP
jgi:hypothetical protein